jgi:hypothetical protein
MSKLTLRNAILVAYNLATFGNHRKTATAASTVEEVYNTNEGAVRVYYSLFGETREYQAVRKALNLLRRHIDSNTSAWLHRGVRVIATDVLQDFRETLQRLELNLATEVEKMVQNLDALKAEAKERLGDLYNEEKYPSVDRVRAAFKLQMHYMPMPVASATTLMGLSDEEIEEFKVAFKRDSAEAYNSAHRETWLSAKRHIERMITNLQANKRALAQKTLDNLCQKLTDISRVSIVADPEFDVVITCINEVLSKVDPADIKKDDTARAALIARLNSVVEVIEESRLISEKDIVDLTMTTHEENTTEETVAQAA